MIESKLDKFWNEFQAQSAETVKGLIREGNRRHVVVRRDESVYLDVPVNVILVGAVLSPEAVALGALGALVTHCSVELTNPLCLAPDLAPDVPPVLDVREPG